VKRDFAVAVCGHLVEVQKPGLAVVEAKLLFGPSGQQIVGALHVGRGEGFAVMPFDAVTQRERQLCPFFVRAPAGRKIRHDGFNPVLRYVLVKQDEVIEDPHHRHDRRDAPFLQDRHAGRAVAVKHSQNAALLLCDRALGEYES
jgi:hypothetical protein